MSDILDVNWENKEKRKWAYLLYKRLEMVTEEVGLTLDILMQMGAPTLEELNKEFKLTEEYQQEKRMANWAGS